MKHISKIGDAFLILQYKHPVNQTTVDFWRVFPRGPTAMSHWWDHGDDLWGAAGE